MAKVSSQLEQASVAQKNTDTINVLIKHIHQPIMMGLMIFGIFTSKEYLGIDSSRIIIILYLFYRAAPRMIQVAKGYGEIIGDSPVDVTPDIKRWEQLRTPKKKPSSSVPPPGQITINNGIIGFGPQIILKNINMTIPFGSMVVIFGRSGAGKSSLLDVLCGFRRLQQGSVAYAGVPSVEIDLEDLFRRQFAIVKPESVVVTGSLADNVAYLSPSVDRARIEELAAQLGLESMASARDGIDTLIEARGANLSAGQRQRIVIARALYKAPSILILDEPTSNLDVGTEQDIYRLIERLKGSLTLVVVSHRESIRKIADYLFEIKDGRITEVEPRTINGDVSL